MASSREWAQVGQPRPDRGDPDAQDRAAIERVLAGDRGAFDQIVDRHGPPLRRVIGRMLGRPELADEATQEAFLRAWNSLGHYRGDATVRSWLFRIATNLCRDMRKRASWSEASTDDPSLLAKGQPLSEDARSPERVAASRRALDALQIALGELPLAQREAVELHLIAGLSYPETAAALGVSVGALKVRVHRARGRLAAALSEHLDDRGDLDAI